MSGRQKTWDILTLLAVALACLVFCFIALNGLFVRCTVETGYSADNNEHVIFNAENPLVNLAVLFFSLGCVYFLLKRPVSRRTCNIATAVMLCCVTAVGAIWVLTAKAEPYADSKFVLDAALQAASGNVAALSGSDYLLKYPFQTGFLLYAEAMVRLFGSGYIVGMQLCNVAFVDLAYLAILRLSRQLFDNNRVELMTILLLLLCLQPIFLCTFLYGVLPGLAAALWGAYMAIRYLKEHRARFIIAAALLIMVAVTLKKNYAIVALACGIVLLLDALKCKFWRSVVAALVIGALSIVGPMAAQASYEARAETRFGSGLPQSAWLAMGLSESSMCSGWHSAEYAVAFSDSGYDAQSTNSDFSIQARERFELLISRPRYFGSFFYHKLTSQWNTPSFQCLWSSAAGDHAPAAERLYAGPIGAALERGFHWFTQLIYFGFVIAMAMLFSKKRRSEAVLLLALVPLGALLYHLVFEAKAQYALPYLPIMALFCAYGLCGLCAKVRGRMGDSKANPNQGR